MGLFDNVQKPTGEVAEAPEFKELTSAIYDAVLQMALVGKSDKGALWIELHYTLPTQGNLKVHHREYISKQTGELVYQKDGKQFFLPGYEYTDRMIRMISQQFTLGQVLADEAKYLQPIKYQRRDFKTKQDVTEDGVAIVALHNKPCRIALLCAKVNKQARNEATGEYYDINDSYVERRIVEAVQIGTNLTGKELAAGIKSPEWSNGWEAKYKDQVKDEFKPVTGAASSGTVIGSPSTPEAPNLFS